MSNILEDIARYRGNPSTGWNPLTHMELDGRTPVEISSYEPDPQTSHVSYYYNSRLNILYKKMFVSKPSASYYVWKRVSQ